MPWYTIHMASNRLNDLVEYGKADVRSVVADMLGEATRADGNRMAETMFSMLALSIKKATPDINVTDIRTLIVEENFAILSEMEQHSPQIIGMFAIATGRVVQITEYLSAIGRIAPTLGAGEAERLMAAHFGTLSHSLNALRRVAVRLYTEDHGAQPMLFDIRNAARQAGEGHDGFPASPH